MRLSVLDQSPVSSGSTPADALTNTIELARFADRLGYERYWIAEHHATQTLASPAPEILIARIGAETERIRVGSGGVMLPHYSPLKVAEQFRMLHALYPDRVDLGIGRAPGGTPLETFALRRERLETPFPDDFPDQLAELIGFLHSEFAPRHPFSRIRVSPQTSGAPPVWLLGSSLWSASAAAQLGLPYAFAHFIAPEPTRAAIEHYRTHFQPSSRLAAPHVIVALGAICAETDAEANRLGASVRLMGRRLRQGDLRPVPTVEEAERELAAPDPFPRHEGGEWPRHVFGSPATVRSGLEALAAALGVDELMIVTIVHEHAARLRSYELLAGAFGLGLPVRPS
ncbi:MAG TPA: LLM class flavin-dependent oxidoreductase [Steroidobacteraceae bacterium]|nr:LLM class flavin-dependent oxidoreductase [Steroidobacteraceae bacterium]